MNDPVSPPQVNGDEPPPSAQPVAPLPSVAAQSAVAVGVLGVSGALMWGATAIPADAGYAGVGPNFLPWVVAAALALCGVALLVQALKGGYQNLEPPSGAARGDWVALAWVVGGVLANAALITSVGFVVSCALCYALAVRGLRLSEGRGGGGLARAMTDLLTGVAIAAPVFWLFTRVLAVNLPALTATGWF
jgi:putative tricarboxylic transport membrane protein